MLILGIRAVQLGSIADSALSSSLGQNCIHKRLDVAKCGVAWGALRLTSGGRSDRGDDCPML